MPVSGVKHFSKTGYRSDGYVGFLYMTYHNR